MAIVAAKHVCDAALLVAEGFDSEGSRSPRKPQKWRRAEMHIVMMAMLRARGLQFDLGVGNAGGCKGRGTATKKQSSEHGEESEEAEEAFSVDHQDRSALAYRRMVHWVMEYLARGWRQAL